MTNTDNKINELFHELVPFKGKADTVAGEIIRAICRINYRFTNDGDHIGIEYGNETCNAAARYLQSLGDQKISLTIAIMWGLYNEAEYEDHLEDLKQEVLDFIEAHPELKTAANHTNMHDLMEPEDLDSWKDDEDEEDEEDEWAEDWNEEE